MLLIRVLARAVIVAMVAALPLIVSTSPASAEDCPPGQEAVWTPTPEGLRFDGCVRTEDPGDPGNPGDPGDPGEPIETGPVPETYQTPACPANGPPPGNPDALCMGAVNSPLCADDEIRLIIFSRLVDRVTGEPVPGPDGFWQRDGYRCAGPDDDEETGIQEPEITVEMVMDLARTSAPEPAISMQPGGESYVNVPNNFYIDSDPIADTLTILGQAIPVVYTSTEHTWDFGDGESGTGAGIADAAVGQRGAVEHAYGSRGDFAVTVTTTYTVTFTIPGMGEVTPEGTISGTSEAYDVTIAEMGSVVTKIR